MKLHYTKNGYDLNVQYEIDGIGPDAIIDFVSIRNQSGKFAHVPEDIREDIETEIIIERESSRIDAANYRIRRT